MLAYAQTRGKGLSSTAPAHKSIRGTIEVETMTGPPHFRTTCRNIIGGSQAFAIWQTNRRCVGHTEEYYVDGMFLWG